MVCKTEQHACCAKTGTSQESRDLWISAFTPYYTASAWGGYDEHKTMDRLSQNWHQKLWRNIMERIQDTKGLGVQGL